MKIISLPKETFDNLASELGKDSTIGWKKLMTKGFNHIYSQQDVTEIEQKCSPAIAVLNDLVGREESVENLIRALEKIGNKRAISIISKGQIKDGRNHQDCDGWPPRIHTREPIEHSINDVPSNVEQAETLEWLPFPIQESGGDDRLPDELERFSQ